MLLVMNLENKLIYLLLQNMLGEKILERLKL